MFLKTLFKVYIFSVLLTVMVSLIYVLMIHKEGSMKEVIILSIVGSVFLNFLQLLIAIPGILFSVLTFKSVVITILAYFFAPAIICIGIVLNIPKFQEGDYAFYVIAAASFFVVHTLFYFKPSNKYGV